jgi:Gpi18-like mannosyltransferase
MEKVKKVIPLFLILVCGFAIRLLFVPRGLSGDIAPFAEWGQRFWDLGAKNFYYSQGWYYTPPVYPPLSNLIFGGLYWLYEHRYVLAQLHNLIKLPPASIMIAMEVPYPGSPMMYTYGYFALLKMPVILADLAIGVLIYKVVFEITHDIKKSYLGLILYIFNPVSIFVSGIWGQTESVIGIFGLLAFVLLYYKKAHFSLPLMFICLYLKPTWVVLLPFYIFILVVTRPKIKQLLAGITLSFVIFVLSTVAFSTGNIFKYVINLTTNVMLPSAKGATKASISAFNFYTIFYEIDRDFASRELINLSLKTWGNLGFLFLNIFTFVYVAKSKSHKLFSIVAGIFIIGIGSFLFMTNMLERYFYAGFPAMVVILSVNWKKFTTLIFINLILFINLFWAFYRRGSDEIDRPLTNNNFAMIRMLSFLITAGYLTAVSTLKKISSRATI